VARAAIVTGAGSGIGLAIARTLHDESVALTVAARRAGPLEAAAAELGDALAVPTDVADDDACARLIAAHADRYGRLDVLVNAAGLAGAGTMESTEPDEWDRLFAVNARGPFVLMRLALPLLRESRGLIVNVASLSGVEPADGLAVYGASKAALISLTDSLSVEVQRDGIRAVTINPGYVDTPMAAGITSLAGDEMIHPDDCAEVVRMLLRLGPRARISRVQIDRVR
jgi:NAD(P)-dependent dehydrogenase (short-subunit alcohol dehydrogenase family)